MRDFDWYLAVDLGRRVGGGALVPTEKMSDSWKQQLLVNGGYNFDNGDS